jgi:hypothetical protein
MTTISDSFNRANETPLASGWTTGTSDVAFNLTGNVAVPSDASVNDDCSIYTGATWGNDQSSKAKLTCTGTAGGSAGVGLCLRHAAAAKTYYRFALDHAASNNMCIDRFVAGAHAILVTWTQTFTDGDTFEYTVTGPQTASVLTVYRNGTQVQQFTDNSTIASGTPGLSFSTSETAATVDDWVGTDQFGVVAAPRRMPLGL